MNVQVRDTPATDTLAKRLRAAREAARYSRPQVATMTGIPSKSIEKFETGEQEPSVSRLLALCQAYGASVEAVLDGGAQSAPSPQPHALPMTRDVAADPVSDALNELDELRENGFRNARRRAMSVTANVANDLRALEPGALIDLARERGVDMATSPSTLDLENAFAADTSKGQVACAAVEDRIVDTAVLGVDLYSISRDGLLKLIDQHSRQFKLSAKGWSWGDHSELVPAVREPLRQLAYGGKAFDLTGLPAES
ncbi:MAG: helix-turn-helix transcriptional regulator [Fimbriimonadaceae bacterium]